MESFKIGDKVQHLLIKAKGTIISLGDHPPEQHIVRWTSGEAVAGKELGAFPRNLCKLTKLEEALE